MFKVAVSVPFALRKTPFYELNVEQGGILGQWRGQDVVSHYKSILDEHKAMDETLGLLDLGYRSFIRLEGPGSMGLLNKLASKSMGDLVVGFSQYLPFIRLDGTVADWVLITRESEQSWLLVFENPNPVQALEYFRQETQGGDCWIENLSRQYAWAGLSGPYAMEFLVCGSPEVMNLKCQAKTEVLIAGVAVHLWRLGDNFFEFACQPELLSKVIQIWWAGEDRPTLCGFSSYENWRLENGKLRYGIELRNDSTPFELGLDDLIELDRDDFPAAKALETQISEGLKHILIYFSLAIARIPRANTPIFCGDKMVGAVCAGGYSSRLKMPIGTAWITAEGVDFDDLKVEIRRQRHDIKITKPPFR